MNTISIIIILVALQLEQVSGLSLDVSECNAKYMSKFGFANTTDGSGTSKLAFTGDVSFVTGTANAKVSLRYTDADLFNDPKYFGLVKEDGKTDDQVCLELKLWKYTSNSYADPVQVTDLTITPSNNSEKQWRYYSFIIPENEFQTRLIQTQNSNQFIYTGYYALAYYFVGTEQLQYTFFFEFSLSIDKVTGAAIETVFKPLNELNSLQGYGCMRPETDIEWCIDLKCTAFATPDLHLNDEFVIQQIITTNRINGYYLTETQVWYAGDGLLKRTSPISINNTIPGQVILQLKAEIAWREVTIKVTSTLSTSQAGGRRMLVQTEFDPVSGQTQQIECIKAEGSDQCSTCEQECDANGFAHDGCPSCSFSQQIAFVFLALLLVFTI